MITPDFLKAWTKQVELDMGWVTVTFQNGKKVHYGDKDRLAEDDERRGFLTRAEGWDESRCRPTGSYDRTQWGE